MAQFEEEITKFAVYFVKDDVEVTMMRGNELDVRDSNFSQMSLLFGDQIY